MSWEKIEEVLLREVVPRMSDQAKGRRWVELLRHSEDGPQLGACMVIDISEKNGALDPSVFASILDCVDFSEPSAAKDAVWAFAAAVKNHPCNRGRELTDYFVCMSQHVADPIEPPDAYVRVVDLAGFIKFFLQQNKVTYASLAQEDQVDVREGWFGDKGDWVEWEDLERMWSGGLGRVFVTSLSELQALLESAEDPGYLVNDGLGLGMGDDSEFLAVRYPAGFPEGCHQPTTLDANWSVRNWYVSNGNEDYWGRTHSCSGDRPPARERVHRKVERLSGFAGTIIGVPKQKLSADRERLRAKAVERMLNYL